MTTLKTSSWLALTFPLIALAGCANEPIEKRADGGAPICTRTYPLGSNIPTTTCVSAEAAAEQKRVNDSTPFVAPIALPSRGGG